MRTCLEEARDKGLLRPDLEIDHLLLMTHGIALSALFAHGELSSGQPATSAATRPIDPGQVWNTLRKLITAPGYAQTLEKALHDS